MRRGLTLVVMLSVAALGLAGCGKRGALEAPISAEPTDKSVEPKSNEKPHRPFVLDSLLR